VPANLPPAYFEADQKYRSAKSPAQKIAALQQMLSATPKHKGTDHLRADLRSKVARATEELENPKRGGGASQYQPYAIRKEGAGQAVLIGLPNAGKSQLMAVLTGAAAKVGDYPFTTQLPMPGMLRHQNILIQMVDTPAINDNDVQTRLFSLLRNSDLLLIVVDLSGDPLSEARRSWRRWSAGATACCAPTRRRIPKTIRCRSTPCWWATRPISPTLMRP
jgi:ribosome-interacting GTPase 1